MSPSLYWVIIGSLVHAMACHLLCVGPSLVHWFKQRRVTFSVLGHHWFIGSSNGVSPSLYWVFNGSLVQKLPFNFLCTGSSLVHWFKQWRVTCSVLCHYGSLVQAMACHLLCTGSSSAHCSSNGVSPSLNWVIIGSLVQAMACHLLCTGSSLVHWIKQWRVTFSVLGHHWFIGSSNGVSPALYWIIIGSLVQAMACHLLCTGSLLVHWFKQWRVTCSVLGNHWFTGSRNGVSPALYWFIIVFFCSSNGVSPALYCVIIGSLLQAMACHILFTGSSLIHWFKQWRITCSVLGHHWFSDSSNGVSPSLYWVIIDSLVQAMACHLLCARPSLVTDSSNGVSHTLYWVINGSLVQTMACQLLCTGSSFVHLFKQWCVTCPELGHHWSIVQAMACHLLCTGSSLVHWFKQWRVTFSVLGHHWFTGSKIAF